MRGIKGIRISEGLLQPAIWKLVCTLSVRPSCLGILHVTRSSPGHEKDKVGEEELNLIKYFGTVQKETAHYIFHLKMGEQTGLDHKDLLHLLLVYFSYALLAT